MKDHNQQTAIIQNILIINILSSFHLDSVNNETQLNYVKETIQTGQIAQLWSVD